LLNVLSSVLSSCGFHVHSPPVAVAPCIRTQKRFRTATKRTNNIYIFMCQITLNLAFIGLPRCTVRMHNKKRHQIADKTGERDRKLAAHRMLPLLESSLFLSSLLSASVSVWTFAQRTMNSTHC